MIRQFTIVPALLAGAAMIISACSAEVGGGGSDGSSSASSSSGSSVSSSQNAGDSSNSQNISGGFSSLSGKVDRVLYVSVSSDEFMAASFLLEDGSIIDRHGINLEEGYEISPVDVKNIKHIPYYEPDGHYWARNSSNVCALTHDSDVYCWGKNQYGQVGNGTYDSTAKEEVCTTHILPNGIETNGVKSDLKWSMCHGHNYFKSFKILSGVKDLISIDKDNTFCALTFDNNAYCWGKNTGFDPSGVTSVSTPFPVDADQYTFTQETENITRVEHSGWAGDVSCEITDAGKVTCQGYNSDRKLLFGKENWDLPYSANPIEIAGVEQAQSFTHHTWQSFSENSNHVCILRKDDKIQCWGDRILPYEEHGPIGVLTYTP